MRSAEATFGPTRPHQSPAAVDPLSLIPNTNSLDSIMSALDGVAPMSISPSPAPQPDPQPPSALDEILPFPLLDLPVEIVLLVISHVDERDYSASFPCGPPNDLLRLSETSRFFLSACRPRIWSAISYAPIPAKQLATPEYRHSRSLSTLNEIVRACQRQESKEQSALFPPVPLVRLSVQGSDNDPHWMLVRALQASQPQTEDAALVELVKMLGKQAGRGPLPKSDRLEPGRADGPDCLACRRVQDAPSPFRGLSNFHRDERSRVPASCGGGQPCAVCDQVQLGRRIPQKG